jgi:hypothetical protein
MLTFSKIREEHLESILKWRTSPDVSRYMFTDIEYDIENQKKWFQKIQMDDASKYWMISYEDAHIGVINLNDIDPVNKHCTWGYYIGEAAYRTIGGLIPPYLYNYVFHEMKFHKIIAMVMEGNNTMMKLHAMHGYQLVGKYERHVYKYDKYHDVFIFELHHKIWKDMRKYKNFIVEFE